MAKFGPKTECEECGELNKSMNDQCECGADLTQ